jgi:hypothetical protein
MVDEEKKTAISDKSKENKTLKNFFIWMGICIAVIVLITLTINATKNFNYHGLKFNFVKEGNLPFYQTTFQINSVSTGKALANYNFYIRNDPRKLEQEVPFEGELEVTKILVVNSTDGFSCEGKGVLAIGNLLNLPYIGVEIKKDENATCDPSGRYTFLEIEPGNETKIEQTGVSCYRMEVSNCEILKGMERFMIEYFVKVKEAS